MRVNFRGRTVEVNPSSALSEMCDEVVSGCGLSWGDLDLDTVVAVLSFCVGLKRGGAFLGGVQNVEQ